MARDSVRVKLTSYLGGYQVKSAPWPRLMSELPSSPCRARAGTVGAGLASGMRVG